MSAVRSCPRCGGTDIKLAHRQNTRERLLSILGLRPFSCRGCRHRFIRQRNGMAFMLAIAAVWVVSAALLGGAAWWLLQEQPAAQGAAPAVQVAHGRDFRKAMEDLHLRLANLSVQKAALQDELARVNRQLSSRPQSPGAQPAEDPRLVLLSEKNRELSHRAERLAREKASLQVELAKLNRRLDKAAAPPAHADPNPQRLAAAPSPTPLEPGGKVLLATISFAPGRTQTDGENRRMIDKIARQLRRRPGGLVVVEGKADKTPLGRDTAKLYYDNAGVALARALSVFRALRGAGVEPSRMRVTAAGAPAHRPDAGRTVSIWLVRSPAG